MSLKTEAALDLDEDLVITLKRPLEGPTGPVTHITITEPTAGQMMMWDKLVGVEADVVAISTVSGIPKSVIEKLPARLFNKAARRIGAFLD
jgi:hypothetical protein